MGFQYSLNTATIRPAKLLEKIAIAKAAGFKGIEPWIGDVLDFVHKTKEGTLADIRKALDDAGLERPSCIALWGYTETDAGKYKAAVDKMKESLAAAAELGIRRMVVSPPRGKVDLKLAGERYGEVLKLARGFGVGASVEFLGFVEGIHNVKQAWEIAGSVGDPEAGIVPDIFHISRGGGAVKDLDDVPTDHIHIFHWNDIPAEPAKDKQVDGDRVLPGQGTFDLKGTAAYLVKKGYADGWLSLELFNKKLWEQDAKEVATSGLAKMKESVAA